MAKIRKIEPSIPIMPVRKKVAAYARVSRDCERLLHSVSAQVSYYSSLIQKNPEWEFAGIYTDYAITGTAIKGRENFQRMIADCEKGDINIILTKSISRFARNTVDLLNTVRHLKSIGVEVRFERENISSLSADGELMLSILASFAEEESSSTSRNIKWAVQKKFESGKTWHTAAFGYRWNGETFIIEEKEAEAVRKIFDDFLNDVPLRHIAAWLNDNGFKNCTVQFVRYALTNEVYCGDKISQKYFSYKIHHLKKNEGELPRYLLTDNHEPIISREIFEQVQAKIKSNYDFNPNAHRMVKPYCFSSKIVCRYCGAHYVRGFVKSNMADGLQENWTCFTKIKHGAKSCCAKNIRGNRLRNKCMEIMGIPEFDEDLFTKSIDTIIADHDGLEFHFYDGRVTKTDFQYFNQADKKHTDPHHPYWGYVWTEQGYIINPYEAECVKLIYQMYADELSVSEISRRIIDMGYKTKKGSFSRKMVQIILDSNLYIGQRTLSGKFTDSGKDEIIPHPVIIDEELNRKVKERRCREYEKSHYHTADKKSVHGSTDK